MIASVSGEVLVRRADHVVIDAGGVGYALAVSAETLKAVPARGKRATLHAHLVARDDALSLYGFASEEERDLFLHLISVSGVGPEGGARRALGRPGPRAACARSPPATRKRFQAVPGIGKRTAERIIVELREKVAGRDRGRRRRRRRSPMGEEDPRSMAREGLLNLGYTPVEAERLLDGAERRQPRGDRPGGAAQRGRGEGGMRPVR